MDRLRSQTSKPSKSTLLIIGVITFLALFGILIFPISSSSPAKPTLGDSKMGIIHIVMFEFKEEATVEEVTDVNHRMLALKDQCLTPTTKKPYVKMAIGGKENSVEELAGGITHAFVVEFENEADRKYYLDEDPAHLEFKKRIGGVVKKVQVVDFSPGVF